MTLSTRLIDRILQARGRKQLRALLKEAKSAAGKAAKFHSSGDDDALRGAVGDALAGNFISTEQLRVLADRLEEVGGQHIYLYRLTEEGASALTPKKIKSAFSECTPSVGYYTETPSGAAVHWVERGGEVCLKQVKTTSFWEYDPSQEVLNDEIKRKVWRRVHRRAVNTLLVDCQARTVEVCIDRVKGENDETLADEQLSAFLDALAPFLDVKAHLLPLAVSGAFAKIVAETTDEAYMNSDGVQTSAIAQKMSNRRKGTRLPDIRKNADYVRAKPKGKRDSLTIYWVTGDAQESATGSEHEPDDDGEDTSSDGKTYVHTIISAMVRDVAGVPYEHCKVYIAAKVTTEARTHVISRIRHFAG